jgi:uncharacterized membrane protein YkvA (DUF1232 family)
VNRQVRLATTANDPSKPKLVRIVCALALVYVIFPFDFLPDLMPVVGWIDDALVIVSAVSWFLSQRKKAKALSHNK